MLKSSAVIDLANNAADGWPSLVDMKVIVPGLVHYDELVNARGEVESGNVLVTKETLDRMAASIEGKPIVNWDHRRVDPKEFGKGKFQGIITGPAIFNAADGWYHAKGYVWDEATRKNIQNGYSISCAYAVDEWGAGPGTYNQVPYLREVKNGTYTHIAVVETPRYERARIELMNAKGGSVMGLLSLFRKDKPEEKVELDLTTPVVLENGTSVPLEKMAEAWRQQEAQRLQLENAKNLKDEDVVDIDGKKVTVKELKNAYGLMGTGQHVENEHKAGKHTDRLSNCGICNAMDDEDKKKKETEDKERQNSLSQAETARKKAEEEFKNATVAKERAEAELRAQELENARNRGGVVEMPTPRNIQDLMKEGEARYGVAPVSGGTK